MFEQHTLVGVLVVGGLGAAALVVVAGLALLRRRTLSYLLVTGAIAGVALRAVLGAVTVGGALPVEAHHLLEHALDALVVGLLFGAIYAARTAEPDRHLDENRRPPHDD